MIVENSDFKNMTNRWAIQNFWPKTTLISKKLEFKKKCAFEAVVWPNWITFLAHSSMKHLIFSIFNIPKYCDHKTIFSNSEISNSVNFQNFDVSKVKKINFELASVADGLLLLLLSARFTFIITEPKLLHLHSQFDNYVMQLMHTNWMRSLVDSICSE